MKVFCRCGKLMGEIIEGSKLRKGYAIVCAECQNQQEKIRQACELFRNSSGITPYNGSKNSLDDIFSDIFSKKP